MSPKMKYERPIVQKNYTGLMNKFGSNPQVQIQSDVFGIPVSDLIKKYGSPLFVISEKKIRKNFKNFNRIFLNRYPKVQFAWSYKTNYLNAVCKIFHQEGAWAEVVSGFEYEKARKLGVPAEKIIFNGPGKLNHELELAINENAKIHIDNFDELIRIIDLTEKLNKTAKVAIRINFDVGIYPKWDRFGFNYENGEAFQAISKIVQNKNLKLIGLHTHIGTYIMKSDAYKIATEKMSELANRIGKEFQIKLEYFDLGGGFASTNNLIGQYLPSENVIPTIENYADAITSTLLEISKDQNDLPTLILETGRALIDDTSSLITTILANKRLADGKRTMVIDAGINLLFTSNWYKHSFLITEKSGTNSEEVKICGPLCMNIDVIRESASLPPLKTGSNLIIEKVGAYNMTQWMQFITMRPNIVMIMDDGKIELIRKAENIETLNSMELIPEKLIK